MSEVIDRKALGRLMMPEGMMLAQAWVRRPFSGRGLMMDNCSFRLCVS